MLTSLKSPLLLSAMLSAILGLTACSSPSSESTDSTAADSATTDTAGADKLDTKFLTIATGGASGPYNIIGTSSVRSVCQNLWRQLKDTNHGRIGRKRQSIDAR